MMEQTYVMSTDMARKGRHVYALLLLSFYCRICDGQSTSYCNAADGVGSWMGDGSCDPQNLNSECDWDGGDCCKCTCEDENFVCGNDGYMCLDPTPIDDNLSTCEEESLPPCFAEDKIPLVVKNTMEAQALAERVNCSGGNFEVEWRGDILVDTDIVVSYGTVLNITGVGPGAIVDGAGKTRLFRVVNASLQLSDVEVRNGNATFGGAIAATDSTLTLNRTSFIGNTATDKNGGAMFLYSSSAVFNGYTEFLNNSAKYGGALHAVSNSSASWKDVSKFKGNSASHSGGALSVMFDSTVVWEEETTFEENAAISYRGGALFLEGRSSASWRGNATFFANHALYEGGAIFIDIESDASWNAGVEFSNNSVTFAGGGAILIAESSTVQFSGGTIFKLNSGASEGGAVSSRASDSSTSSGNKESFLWINGTIKFANNTCGKYGGGLALLGGLHVLFGSGNITFIGNEAEYAGGGVYISASSESPTFLTNASFRSNAAEVGGGAFVSGSAILVGDQISVTFYGCSFIDNKAATTSGAIEIVTGAAVIINTLFKGNRAESAGALRISGPVSLYNCTFEDNVADVNGVPAISITSIMYTLDITTCYFSGNSLDCPIGTFLDESGSGDRFDLICSGCETCTGCTIKNRWKVPTCLEALEHSISPGGHLATIETLLIDPGYWRATNESTRILPCYNDDACVGGLTGSAEFCQEGYTGPYCAVCTEKYVKGPGFTCIKCSDNVWGIMATAVIVVIAMVVAFTVFTFLISTEMAGTGSGITARLLRLVPLHSVKIIIVVWQILTQFTMATGLKYPGLYQHFLDAVSILNFDISWMLSAACVIDVDFHGRLFIVTTGPIMVMLFLSGTYVYVLYRYCDSKEALENLRNKHMSMVLFVMFLVYSTSSSVVFQMFGCEVLDDGENYLRADYTIECDEPRHQALIIYSSFMIILYPLGIPAFFSYLLFRNRSVLMDGASREESLSVSSISDLWRPYIPSRFYFEIIECGRRIVLTGVVFIIYADSAAQISMTIMLVFVITVVSECLAPYESQLDAWISRLGHVVVFCSMYYALLLKVDVSKETHASQSTFGVVLVATHLMMVMLVVGEATLTGCFLLKEQVEDPRPRFNRHRPQGFRTASHSLRLRRHRAVIPLHIEPAPLTMEPI